MVDYFFCWPVVGVIFAVLLGFGRTFMNMGPSEALFARICFTIAALLLLAKFGTWIANVQVPLWQRILSVVFVFGLIGIGWVECWRYLDSRYQPVVKIKHSFNVEVRSALVSDSGPLTLYMAGYPSILGKTASPIFYLTYLQITSLQDAVNRINELKIAASNKSDGPWEDLVPIPLGSVALYALGGKVSPPKTLALRHETYRLAKPFALEDMKQAMPLKLERVLDFELSKPIQPHSTVNGWAAFDSRSRKGLTPGQIYFRVTIRDANQNTESRIVAFPTQPDSSIHVDAGSMYVSGQVADISGYKVRYYSDPLP